MANSISTRIFLFALVLSLSPELVQSAGETVRGPDFQIVGSVVGGSATDQALLGGPYSLRGEVSEAAGGLSEAASWGLRGGIFGLERDGEIFRDGFEAGGTQNWN